MGGNLAWTLRTEDGNEYRMDRWTNALPTLIVNPDFLDGKPSAIDEALTSWLEMKEDWQENHQSGAFKLPMTGAYAPYPFGLQPSEYGLVVTCFKTKRILSCQGYTDLSQCSPIGLSLGMERSREVFGDRIDRIEKMISAGRITSYNFLCKDDRLLDDLKKLPDVQIETRANSHKVTVPAVTTYEELAGIVARHQPDFGDTKIMFEGAIADLSPFVLEEFPDTADGFKSLKDRIHELGFNLTEEEETAWSEYISKEECSD